MFVLTAYPDDGPPVHVELETKAIADDLYATLTAQYPTGAIRVDERPFGWECDGSDGCVFDA